MNIKNIKEFLENNKEQDEVKQLLEGYKQVSVQDIEDALQNDTDVMSWFDSERDKHASKSLSTWQENNLETLINEKVKELNPDKSPQDIEIEKIRKQLADMERKKAYEELKNKALTIATEEDLPLDLVEYFIGEDEESTISNLVKLKEEISPYIQRKVEERLSHREYVPGGIHNIFNEFIKPGTKDVTNMSYKEKLKLKNENPEAYQKMISG